MLDQQLTELAPVLLDDNTEIKMPFSSNNQLCLSKSLPQLQDYSLADDTFVYNDDNDHTLFTASAVGFPANLSSGGGASMNSGETEYDSCNPSDGIDVSVVENNPISRDAKLLICKPDIARLWFIRA